MRNGFSQIVPTTNDNVDKPLIEDQFGISINGPEFININPLDVGILSKSSPARFPEQETIELKEIDPLVPEIDASLNVIIKSGVENLAKEQNNNAQTQGSRTRRQVF